MRDIKSIDIIIPIYNAYEDLVECIDSVLSNTTNVEYRLLLIDDKSTDQRIAKYLKRLKKNNKKGNIFVLINKENLGFVKTVNKGMAFSNSDVVLLNSDTIVTKNWLKKIVDCAYSNENIATVTPLTNYGNTCSVPEFCKFNELPTDLTIEEFALLIERVSLRKYPMIPSAVGFCMFIKRSVINEIGFFDESYNKGYAEEADFSCRAIEYGFINVLCDNTFVYHKGAKSFKEDRERLLKENSMVLASKYPFYINKNKEFKKLNPLRDIQDNIKFYLCLLKNSKRKNILYLTANEDSFECKLQRTLSNDEFNVFVFCSNGQELFLKGLIDGEVFGFKFTLSQRIDYKKYYLMEYKEILEQIVIGFNIKILHVFSLKGHTFDISEIARKYNIPLLITINDCYLICPFSQRMKDCLEKVNLSVCSKCISDKTGFSSDYLRIRSHKVLNHLRMYEEIYLIDKQIDFLFESYGLKADKKTKLLKASQITTYLKKYKHLCCFNTNCINGFTNNFKPSFLFSALKEWENSLKIDIISRMEVNFNQLLAEIGNIDKETFEHMIDTFLYIEKNFSKSNVNYVIWGTGTSGFITFKIFTKLLPNFKLIGFIDKNKRGIFEGVKINTLEELEGLNYDYIIISTVPGKEEVENYLKSKSLMRYRHYMYGYGVV